uniref:Transmembrane protein n=1 Tax=Clandestinovirus TaxID=2831644 RepID=A0A8F8PN67_9VIRU|nr:transmembrane protein [Clandestinovirus]
MYSSKKYTPWILAGIGVVGVTGYLAYNQGWYDKYMQGASQKQVAAQTKQAQQLNQRAAYLKQQAAATGDSGLYAEANRCEHQANAIMYKLKQQATTTAAVQEPVKAAQSAAVQSATAAQTSADAAQKAVQAAGQHPQAVQAAKQAQTAAQVAKTAATQAKATQNPAEVAKQTQVAANAAVVATQQANVATQVATQQPAAAQQPAAQQNMIAEASTGMADQFDVQYPGFPGTELDFISNFNGADEQATKDFQQQQGVPRPTQIGNVHQPVDQFLGSYRDFEFYNSGCSPAADAYVYSSSDVAPNAPGPMASGIDSATVLKPSAYPDVVSADGFSQITIDGPRSAVFTDNIFDDGTALSRRFNQNYDLRSDLQPQIYNPEMMAGFGVSISTHGAFSNNTMPVRETIA